MTISRHLELFGGIWSIWSHIEPFRATWSHLESFGAIWSCFEPLRVICTNLDPFSTLLTYPTLHIFPSFPIFNFSYFPTCLTFPTFSTFPTLSLLSSCSRYGTRHFSLSGSTTPALASRAARRCPGPTTHLESSLILDSILDFLPIEDWINWTSPKGRCHKPTDTPTDKQMDLATYQLHLSRRILRENV